MTRRWLSLSFSLALVSLAGCKDSASDEASTASDETPLIAAGVQPEQASGVTGPLDPVLTDLDAAKAALTFAAIGGENPDPDHVRTDLSLPVAMSNGVTIAWATSHAATVSLTGAVNRPPFNDGNASVTLTATLEDDSGSTTKTFALVVITVDPTDQQAVDAALTAMTESLLKRSNASLATVTGDLNLPVSWDHGVALAWASTDPSLASSGAVTRPSGAAANAEGDLTVTAAKGSVTGQKAFHFTVLKILPVLMITEISPTVFDNTGWIEILNTSPGAVQLSDFGFRACDHSYTCTPTTGTLPSVVIGSGKYFLLHPDHAFNGSKVNGPTDAFVPGLFLNEQKAFFELTRAGQTIDFVRWQDGSHANTVAPSTGTFTSVVPLPNGLGSTSLGRKYPYNDSNAAVDWIVFPRSSPGGANGTGAAAGTDTDGDGLTDDYETNVSHTSPTLGDTDGDWFTDGQEVLDQGIAGINLRELGADPLVRDLFVEIDWMANPAGLVNALTDTTVNAYMLPVRRAALDLVRDTFANYVPDGNDANPYGFRVHFDAGDLFDQQTGINPANYDLGGGNALPFSRCLYLGTDGTHTASNCANVYKLKQDNFDVARRNVFHYFVFGWSQDPQGNPGSSGLAELFGNDGLVTVGSWHYGPGLEQYIVNVQAATLLHELGHNLGLAHGGDENANYKPNYVSTMNYEFQVYGLDHNDNGDVYRCAMGYPGCSYDNNYMTTAFKLGYSRGGRATLDEANLSEPQGWAAVAIDFNADGDQVDLGLNWNVQPSTYNTSSTDVHRDFDDWNALFLAFQGEEQNAWNGVSIRPPSASLTDSDQQTLSPPCVGPLF